MQTEIDIHPQVIREGLIERDYRGVLDRLRHWKWDCGIFFLSSLLPLVPYFSTVMSSVWVWLTACINCNRKSPYHLFACPLALPEHILTPTHLFSAQKCFFGQHVGWTFYDTAATCQRVKQRCCFVHAWQLFIQRYLFFPGGISPCAHKPAVQKLKAAGCAVMQFTGAYNERPGTRRALSCH